MSQKILFFFFGKHYGTKNIRSFAIYAINRRAGQLRGQVIMDLYTIKVGPKTVADRLSLDKAKQLLPKYGPDAKLVGPWSSGPQPLQQRFKKESSVVANIKGFQSPDMRIVRRKKMTNPSKPYDESRNFENLVT